jgi:hypothetical protein
MDKNVVGLKAAFKRALREASGGYNPDLALERDVALEHLDKILAEFTLMKRDLTEGTDLYDYVEKAANDVQVAYQNISMMP